jgi:hypothetical protein
MTDLNLRLLVAYCFHADCLALDDRAEVVDCARDFLSQHSLKECAGCRAEA